MKLVSLVLALLACTPVDAAAGSLHGDVEVDPTAYVLAGNSIHVGVSHEHLRFDLGNFGLALPRAIQGNPDFDVAFDGYGAKLQWFPDAEQRGLFVGVEASVTRTLIQRRGTDLAARDFQLGTGAQVGYRITLPAGLYVTPWIGVGYQWGADDVMLDGTRYRPRHVTVFPAVHVGYRFR